MARSIDGDALIAWIKGSQQMTSKMKSIICYIKTMPTTDAVSVVRCEVCRKSHIDGKTTHYLWCTEWGRSTDTFGYCERGEREGE